MKYVTDSFMWQPKDYRDQPLHVLAGGAPVALAAILSGNTLWITFLVTIFSIALGGIREYRQHTESKIIVDLDFLFWAGGAVFSLLVFTILKFL